LRPKLHSPLLPILPGQLLAGLPGKQLPELLPTSLGLLFDRSPGPPLVLLALPAFPDDESGSAAARGSGRLKLDGTD
jgi:hypothetical protein